MNFQTYVNTVLLRARPMDRDKQIKHALIGLVTEVGELGDAFKRNFVYGKAIDNVNVMEECGDLLWYFVLLCDTCHVHMGKLDAVALIVAGPADAATCPVDATFALNYAIANLSMTPIDQMSKLLNQAELISGVLSTINLLLHDYGGYTLSDCMAKNDAKLELRTGKKYDAHAILNRDTAAERAALEQQ